MCLTQSAVSLTTLFCVIGIFYDPAGRDMYRQLRRRFQRLARPFVAWCLLVAIPVFGLSGTMVELLGANHIHRQVASADLGVMSGWIDMRRASGAITVPHVHTHSHTAFARHHHDRDDDTVVALDGGAMQGDGADDGATSGASQHVLALTDAVLVASPSPLRFAWLDAAAAAALPWMADVPLRPPKV